MRSWWNRSTAVARTENGAVEVADAADRLDRAVDVVDRGSRCGRRMISGIDPSGYAITGVPVANDSTTEAERLGEADEVQQRRAPPEQRVPLGRPDRAHVA